MLMSAKEFLTSSKT